MVGSMSLAGSLCGDALLFELLAQSGEFDHAWRRSTFHPDERACHRGYL
jgi:hypothetical protein